MTHTVKEEGLPSRPDVHVLFVIMLPLLQVRISSIHLADVAHCLVAGSFACHGRE